MMEAGVVVMQSVGKVNTVVNLRNQHMVIVYSVLCGSRKWGMCAQSEYIKPPIFSDYIYIYQRNSYRVVTKIEVLVAREITLLLLLLILGLY